MVTNKLPAPKKHRSRLFVAVPVAILIVGALFIGLELTNVTDFIHKSPAKTGPTAAQKKQEDETFAKAKKQAIENPTTTTPTPAPSSSSITLSTKQESNGSVTVFTNLGNVADGTCTLVVTNGAKTTTQTAAVIYQPQYSTCAGFSVPVSSVGSGTWNLALSVTSGGTTVSQSIQADVQ